MPYLLNQKTYMFQENYQISLPSKVESVYCLGKVVSGKI